MQITDYELYAVPPRWLFLRLETDDGTVGWGEPIVQGRHKTVRAAVSELIEDHLLGADPLRIEYHWRRLYQSSYFRGGPILMSALAGIDQALWDIKGRHHEVPVYDLLGGHVRDRLLVYQWVGGRDPSGVADSAAAGVEQGYRAFKINLTTDFRPIESSRSLDSIVERLAAVRDVVGDDVLIGIDFHGRVSKPMVYELIDRLEPYDLMFVDQPLLPEHVDSFASISRRTDVPIATGERLYSRYDFKTLLTDDAVSILQPDVSHVGGITEMRKVATMAESFDVALVPHCPLGPIAFAASLQVGFSSQNVVLQEQDLALHAPESSPGLSYLEDPETFTFEDGHVERPEGNGIGIDIDESYVREQAKADVNWHNPIWYHEDGSVSEW